MCECGASHSTVTVASKLLRQRGGRLGSREMSHTAPQMLAVTLWLKGAMVAQFGSCLSFCELP